MATTGNTTQVNGSEDVDSPSPMDFVEYRVANWLWMYIAPVLLMVGVAGMWKLLLLDLLLINLKTCINDQTVAILLEF